MDGMIRACCPRCGRREEVWPGQHVRCRCGTRFDAPEAPQVFEQTPSGYLKSSPGLAQAFRVMFTHPSLTAKTANRVLRRWVRALKGRRA